MFIRWLIGAISAKIMNTNMYSINKICIPIIQNTSDCHWHFVWRNEAYGKVHYISLHYSISLIKPDLTENYFLMAKNEMKWNFEIQIYTLD